MNLRARRHASAPALPPYSSAASTSSIEIRSYVSVAQILSIETLGRQRLAALHDVGEARVRRARSAASSCSSAKRATNAGSSKSPRARERRDLLQRVLRVLRAAGEDALEAEQRLRDRPALVQLADQVRARHAHVVEEHLAELLVAGDVPDRPHRDAGRFRSTSRKLMPSCFFTVLSVRTSMKMWVRVLRRAWSRSSGR